MLAQTVTAQKARVEGQRPFRLAILGIGHELRGDDAAGLTVARNLAAALPNLPHVLIVEAGHAPENHTGPVRRFAPDLVLLIDVALMGQSPGTICWLPWPATSGLSASSHTMPPYMLARYLTTMLDCDVALLGIQPADNSLVSRLSAPVQRAVDEVTAVLQSSLTADRAEDAVNGSG